MKRIQFFYLFLTISFLPYCCDKEDESLTECQVKCNLAPDSGGGIATSAKYYFDNNEKKCKWFIWKGNGGVVPFETLEACEACGCK
jgi:hypothetical protein